MIQQRVLPPPPVLPAGYIAQWSNQYDRYFYVNTATGVSQWDLPVHSINLTHSGTTTTTTTTTVSSSPVAPVVGGSIPVVPIPVPVPVVHHHGIQSNMLNVGTVPIVHTVPTFGYSRQRNTSVVIANGGYPSDHVTYYPETDVGFVHGHGAVHGGGVENVTYYDNTFTNSSSRGPLGSMEYTGTSDCSAEQVTYNNEYMDNGANQAASDAVYYGEGNQTDSNDAAVYYDGDNHTDSNDAVYYD